MCVFHLWIAKSINQHRSNFSSINKMMAPQWLSRVIIVQLGCLGIRIRNNCQLPLLSSAGLLHAFIISCLWFHLIIIFILYLILDMCLHLVIKYNWPITSPSEQLSSLPWYIDICHDLRSIHHLSMLVLVIGEIDLSSRQSSCVAMQCTWCKYFLLYTKFHHVHRVLPTSSSSSSSLLSWRLTCQLKPAVVSGGDHQGTINRRQGPFIKEEEFTDMQVTTSTSTTNAAFNVFSKNNWLLLCWTIGILDVRKHS